MRCIIFFVLSAFFSIESTAANLTMNELAGTWLIKKKIIEDGGIPLDANGKITGNKTLYDNCEITPLNQESGHLKCGDEIYQVDIIKKKLFLTPLAYAPYNGFIKTLEQSWYISKNNPFISSKNSSYSDPKLSGPISVTKLIPLNIVNKKKISNGAIRLEANYTSEYCYTFSRYNLTCKPSTDTVAYEVKYLSLTR